MVFDLEEGLYIFEITLGYRVGESEYMTVPFILRADDANEAEEMVQEYLEIPTRQQLLDCRNQRSL